MAGVAAKIAAVYIAMGSVKAGCRLIFSELYALGIRHVCIAPGSRSSQLALAAIRHQGLNCHKHFDERGLGFFALGLAKSTRQAVVIVTTSGSALANLHPAVVEAKAQRVPLLLLTADRPGEAHDRGSNQTMTQSGLFGESVAFFHNLSVLDIGMAAYIRDTMDYAVFQSENEAGPVHINIPFREPVLNEADLNGDAYGIDTDGSDVHMRYLSGLSRRPAFGPRGVVFVGINELGPSQKKSLERWARQKGWCVVVDSPAEFEVTTQGPIMAYSERLLSDSQSPIVENDIEIVLLGERFIGRALMQFLGLRNQPVTMIQSPGMRYNPSYLNGETYFMPADRLATILSEEQDVEAPDPWGQACVKWIRDHAMAVDQGLLEEDRLTEISVVSSLLRNIPEHSQLFCSNSMPVRLLNRFWYLNTAKATLHVNRGVSGIDGTIATAAGHRVGSKRPMILLTGDLAFLYDSNALSMLTTANIPLLIVVLNNQGGGIFNRLKSGRLSEDERSYFLTEPKADIATVANGYGVSSVSLSALEEFKAHLSDWHRNMRPLVLDVRINLRADAQHHKQAEMIL